MSILQVLTPESYQSWNTLLEAARIRNYTPVLQLAEKLAKDEIPNCVYHRTCRNVFIMKKDLETLKRKADFPATNNEANYSTATKYPNRGTLTSDILLEQKCLFCEKNKCLRGSSTLEKLVKATQM